MGAPKQCNIHQHCSGGQQRLHGWMYRKTRWLDTAIGECKSMILSNLVALMTLKLTI